jgi:hypothetical protein
MAIHGFPGGVISATAPTISPSSASGVWTLDDQLQNINNWPQQSARVQRSLRFRSSASASLSRTPASTGNQRTFTFSFWVKRGSFGDDDTIIGTRDGSGNQVLISFNPSNQLRIFSETGGGANDLRTNAVYRDPSSWYHIVCAYDTTQATASNRTRVYVNGSEITSFVSSAYPAQNTDLPIFISGQTARIGARSGNDQFFDGYLAEFNFVNGQQLTPSSFGATNASTGVWQPRRYAGTYGTNGFYLPFTDNSTTTTLGNDFSGNGNNWTTNNISLTAGSTYDSMTDVPTLTSATAANFCVVNPVNSQATISNANLTVSKATSGQSFNIATQSILVPTYFEASMGTFTGSNNVYFGVGSRSSVNNYSTYLGFNSFAWSLGVLNGTAIYPTNNNVQTTITTTSNISTDVWMVAVNPTTGKIWWGKNGTWFASGNPSTDSNPMFSGLPSELFSIFDVNGASANQTVSVNYGQRPFAYTPPTGFVALNTFNLPTPTIGATASTQANKYMDATTYTANGTTQTITNSGSMQPDLVWTKRRDSTSNHLLIDSVRGVGLNLSTNSTAAEVTDSVYLTSFNSNGFSIGTGNYSNGNTMVAWQWDAGTTTVTNTSGTISAQVRANTTAGFSIVTYTGNASVASFGHGLGVTPNIIIIKNRSASGSGSNWCLGANVSGLSWNWNTDYMYLNTTGARATDGGGTQFWSAPTSTVVNIGGGTNTNGSGNSMLAYCWTAVAGYSAFGTYTGTGSSDGAFLYTGFRPKFVLFRRTDSTGGAAMVDSSRDPFNVAGQMLYPYGTDAEGTNPYCDLVSNGFKVRGTSLFMNASGGTYIYMAFAETPFNYANAR